MGMKLGAAGIGIGACATLVASLALGNPALETQNEPGYPMPGTPATAEYGKQAEQKAIAESNKELMGDCVKGSQPAKADGDKEGYPYPGTKATAEYGKEAEQRATTEVNQEVMGGVPCSDSGR